MEKDKIEGGKTPDPGERRQWRAARRGDGAWFNENRACRALYGRGRHCGDRSCWNL
jgi:hypothetical protein